MNPESGSGEEIVECFNYTSAESVPGIQNLFQCSTPDSKNNQNLTLTQEQETSLIETSTENGTKRKLEDSSNDSIELTLINEKVEEKQDTNLSVANNSNRSAFDLTPAILKCLEMTLKLDNSSSKIVNSNITQSFQSNHDYSKFMNDQLPKAPKKIGCININGIKRKLNSLRIMINKNKLDIVFVQQIYNFDKANIEKWLIANKF